jgi:rhodanese-related sulfurtransferase
MIICEVPSDQKTIKNKQMKHYLLLAAFTCSLLIACAQLPFKNDNVLYNAVFLNEAFRMMDKEKNFLLLDVRSPGEYADTSQYTALNIGRLKGAININIDAVPGRLNELEPYKEKPVFIYCSHSQRSRRVSKLLSENGFKKIYNINGGMSVVNEMDADRFPYKNKVHETHTGYKNIASIDAARLIKNTPDLVIIDIRSEQAFASKDSLQQNNIGRFKKAINIPQAVFAEKFDSYKIPAGKPVLVYDQQGNNSMDLMNVLKAKGFTRLYNLYEGLNAFSCDHAVSQWRNELLIDQPAYKLLDPQAAITLLNQQPGALVLDARVVDEFENKSAISYHNLGRIKDAVNIASVEALEKWMPQQTKNKPILVYGGMGGDSGAQISQALVNNGFTNVHLLSQGLYRFVWATANIEDCKAGRAFLTNHEGLY